MNDASQSPRFDAVARYAELVRRLRAGKAVAPPPPDPDDPLAALGQELVSLASELTHREAELQRLFELVQNAEHGVSPEDVLTRIFDGFSDLIPYDRIGCAFLSEDGERLKAHWARSNLGPARLVVGFSRPMAGSSLLQILETRQPRILNDLEAYLEAKPFSLSTRLVVEEGGRSSLTCPLIANGRPIGFLFFTSREVNAYRDIHQSIFNQIANQISIVIEKSRIFQQIAYAARHDALTGLPNRALFFETLTRTLARVGEDGSLAVLYLDLDHFKRVNDTLGHPVGDILLKKMARRLRRCVGARGAVARLGGDEFAVIQGPISSAAEVATLADDIGEAVRAPLTIDGYDVDVDVSIGAAIAPEHSGEVDELLKKADVALYDVKKAGRGAFRLFRPEMTARAIERMDGERDLRRALTNNEFELHYQPIISLTDDRIVAVEALARWRHPQRGLVLPSEFIPIAEEVGLIDALGEWALRTACAEAAGWPTDARVAVNVSARQFAGRGLVATVVDAVRSAGLRPERLELEVTESVFLEDSTANLAIMRELTDFGVTLALDDFGAGFSSLGYLQTFSFSRIKIDRAFVAGLPERRESSAIVRAISQLAQTLHIDVTAEGVETTRQMREVQLLGCTEMQGFLFARPCPAAELRRLLLLAPSNLPPATLGTAG
jgi:diguanylate cyclase (GGDEF)-like protein